MGGPRGREQAASRGRAWVGCRLVVALALGMAAVGCLAEGPRPGADASAPPVTVTWRRIFPHFRVVGYHGMPGLDALGAGPPEVVAPRLLRAAAPYATPGRRVLPMFELIATIAHPWPLGDGTYRSRQDDAVVARYLRAVRRIKGVLVLDIQPGRADFLAEVRHWERFLRQPDVGIALDPEFSMPPGGVPGRDLGHTNGATINRVSAYLAGLVARHRLPEKLLVIHQFTHSMVQDKPAIMLRKGLAMVWNADGFGPRSAKLEDYATYTRDRRFHPGLKLFYHEDANLTAG